MMCPESIIVEGKSKQAQPFAIAEVIVERLHVRMPVQAAGELVQLRLRVHKLQQASVVPPGRRRLHQYSVWLDLFNKFLSSLGEHG